MRTAENDKETERVMEMAPQTITEQVIDDAVKAGQSNVAIADLTTKKIKVNGYPADEQSGIRDLQGTTGEVMGTQAIDTIPSNDVPMKRGSGRPSNGTSALLRMKMAAITEKNPEWTQEKIAKAAGVATGTVKAYLKQCAEKKAEIEEFRGQRADLFAEKQKMLMRAITPAKIAKSGLKDAALALGIIYDKERLERGEATSNVAGIIKVLQVADTTSCG